jgi:hypothetical protein
MSFVSLPARSRIVKTHGLHGTFGLVRLGPGFTQQGQHQQFQQAHQRVVARAPIQARRVAYSARRRPDIYQTPKISEGQVRMVSWFSLIATLSSVSVLLLAMQVCERRIFVLRGGGELFICGGADQNLLNTDNKMQASKITDWVKPNDSSGEFKRQQSSFRDWISTEEGAKFPPEKGRYHLYVSYACPWVSPTPLYFCLESSQTASNIIDRLLAR